MLNLPTYRRPEFHEFIPAPTPEKKRLSRRCFGKMALRVGTAMAVSSGGFVVADSIRGEYFWAGTHPGVHEVYASPEQLGEFKRGVFVLPGFNVANLEHGAKAQLPVLKTTGDYVAHVTYGNSGFDIRDIHRSVRDDIKKRGIERVMFAAQSMGGMVAFDVAKRLYEQDDIMTDRIFFYSSPFDFSHLQPNSQTVIKSLAMLDSQPLHLGPDARFIAEFFRQLNDGDSIAAAYGGAEQLLTSEGCSNVQLETVATYMKRFTLADYRGHMPLETQYVYMCASQPEKDAYVDVTKPPTALNDTIFGNKIILTSPDVGHADITVSHHAFQEMTRQGIAACDYRDYMLSLPRPLKAGGI